MRIAPAILIIALIGTAPLAAHESGTHRAGPSPWDAAAMTLLCAGAAAYGIGARRMARRGARVRISERVAFWSGWVALMAAVAPPLDRAAATSFSSHMAQHELLMIIGAPLIIVGRPIVPWLWSLPARLRTRAGAGLQLRPASALWRGVTTPFVAWVLHGTAIWLWHVPVLYEAAVHHEAIHALQHATFVGTAAVFWWGLVYGRYGRAAYGASVLYVFTTMLHTGILGALFALSRAPFYPHYAERAVALGFDPAIDQQLAGLYMWIPAGVVLTVFGLALLLAWLSESERRAYSH
jgi:putative membrane protein